MQKNGVNNNDPKKVRIMNIKKLAYSASVLAIMCIGLTNAAYADCTSPASPEGGLAYFTTDDTYRLCDGADNWITLTTGISVSAINDLSDALADYATDYNIIMGRTSAAALTSGAQFNIFIGQDAGATSGNSTATTDGNTAIGYTALTALTTGSDNVAIGYRSLNSNTTGARNISIGVQSMYVNVGGTNNTATGYNSLYSNTSGGDNTAYGYQSLFSNDAKEKNTAIGSGAMYYADSTAVASDANNTAIGFDALRGSTTAANNTGVQNTAIGSNAGAAVTTGGANVLVGYNAYGTATVAFRTVAIGNDALGNAGNGADYNVAVGDQALYNGGGDNNVAVGRTALYDNGGTTGFNTAVGNAALRYIAGGTSNTAIGYEAGLGSNGVSTAVNQSVFIGTGSGSLIETGDNNIFVGYQAGDLTTSGSDNIIIGHDIDAPLATTSNHLNIGGLIRGDLANGDFIVGSYQLDDTTTGTEDNRMFFDGSKGAFRAGNVTGTEWDDGNVGIVSTAMGIGTTASGLHSTAFGHYTQATGEDSTAMGHLTRATADYATSMGRYTRATGSDSLSAGRSAEVSGASSIGVGLHSTNQTTRPLVSGNRSAVFYFGGGVAESNSAYDFTASDKFAVIGGEFQIDDVSASANKGCIRYNSTSTKIEYSHDCSTYAEMGAASGSGAGLFEVSSNVVRAKSSAVAYATDDFVFGSTQLADTTDTNHDARMFFDKSKGSFRAGTVNGTQWDDASIGSRSFATNYNTRATNDNSFAAGSNTIASGQQAVAMGSWTVASSNNAFAMGSSSTASGNNTFAMGSNVIANGFSSVAMINEVNVTGDFSVGFGMGAPIGVDPIVSGVSSFGIFMDDQNGVDLSQANTMAIMGGNLGIGTVTPATAAVLHLVNTTNDARLHFTNGDGTSGDINYDMGTDGFEFRTGGTSGSDTKMFIGDNGRVGVGTTSPTGTLDVITAGNTTDTILRIGSGVDNSNTSRAELQLRERNGGDYARGFNLAYDGAAGDHFVMEVLNSGGTTEVMHIERADGDMGLGDFSSDSIESKLHIASGDIRLDGGAGNQAGCLRFNDTSDKMEYSHDCSTFSEMGSGSGASAINDLSDAYADYGVDDNLFMGENAGAAILGGGQYNTFVGVTAGAGTTTGDRNTAFGMEALSVNSTGLSNTATGYHALYLNTTASYNTAHGTATLRSNTNGTRNSAQGYRALYNNTTGDDNTASGYGALDSSVGRHKNTAFGAYAMEYADDETTGNSGSNVAVGFRALRGSATPSANDGTHNVAMGSSAMVDNESGADNVGVGHHALYVNSDGNNNTSIGSSSLAANTLGNDNTALGYQAGNLTTTGSGNIFIGNGINAPLITTSNHLNIGNTLYGDLSTDSIGIGQVPAAGVELDVLGDIEYTGTITDVSDRRLKTDIEPLTISGNLLNKIDQIDTYSFRMKDDKDARLEFGVMAQDLEKIFPELVHTAQDEMGTKSVNYVGLIAPMIEATKELNAENKALKSAQIETNAAITNLNEQVALLNKMAGNNVGKASMMPYLMMLFGLLGGIGIMIIIQRKQQR